MPIKEKVQGAWNVVCTLVKIMFRRLRLVRINRNFIVFLVFLLTSIGFWCLQTLEEQTTVVLSYRLRITNVPKNVIFTTDLPNDIAVNVTGRGYDILQYQMKQNSENLDLSYTDLKAEGGKLEISQNALRRALMKKLGNSIDYNSSTPTSITIFYTTGKCKRVPVIFDGKVTTGLQHVLCDIQMTPDSVDIYAPQQMYDSIHAIFTSRHIFKDVEDTTTYHLALTNIRGVKVVPDSVEMKVCVDLFTEKTVPVKVYCENVPRNKIVRTFPSKVNVTFHVSATIDTEFTKDDFVVLVNYNNIKKGDTTAPLILSSKPDGVSHVQVSPEKVEFIIENEYE